MAKRLILNVLVRVLGEFIELDENNFSLAVWSGTVVLTNLKLKADNILQKFNFIIYHGFVERLEIVIPWASLLTNPLKIKLEGVLLDLGPVDLDGLNKEEILKMMIQEKLQKLKMRDQFLDISSSIVLSSELQAQNSSSNSNSETYIQQWSSRIIDNIEIAFSKIHVRYEDSITISGKTVAAGVTLDSFVLATCDEEWHLGFQSKQAPGGKEIIYKLAAIEGMGIYWDIEATPISSLQFNEWKAAMIKLIYCKGYRDPSLNYILSPKGSTMFMKLAHNKKAGAGEVRFAITLENSDLRLTLDNQQYKQIYTLYSNLAALKEVRDPNNLRPSVRPFESRAAVRQWWQYGKRLVLLRPKYLRILKLIKKAQSDKVAPEFVLTVSEMKEFETIEERLPLKVLEAFRKRLVAELVEEQKLDKSKESKKEGVQWWGWLGASSASMDELDMGKIGDDISVQGIIDELDRLESSNARQAFQAVSLSLSTGCTVSFSSNNRNILKVQAALSVFFEKKFDTIHAKCELENLLVTDELGICPFHEKIISMKAVDHIASFHGEQTKGTTIIADVVHGKTNIQIFSLPLEIYVNKLIIHAMLTEFSLPKQNKARRIKRKMHVIKLEEHLGDNREENGSDSSSNTFTAKSLSQAVIKGQADITVSIKVHGPKIIIPEDSARDLGCLLLDCGYIELSSVVNSSGMSCDLRINAVNAGLPLTLNDVYCLKGTSLYLIKPFDLALVAQNLDQSEADMTVNLSLSPGVNGELDKVKLARLLRIANGMTDITSPKSSVFASENSATAGASETTPITISRHASGNELAALSATDVLSPASEKVYDGPVNKTQTISSFPVMSPQTLDQKDPRNVDMKIKVNIVSISLDLMYEQVGSAEHILFMMKGLDLEMINRPYDRQINFMISDLSIQDSWRCEMQRFVAWTPQSSTANLITVSYMSAATTDSPLYSTHGSEVRAEFTELCLSVDTATLLHLKPFMEVLLDKSNRTTPIQTLMTDAPSPDDNDTGNNSGNMNRYRLISMLPSIIDGPIGMKVEASLGLISINLLRAPTSMTKHERGTPLEPAFSTNMMQMRVTVDMKDLMNSTLRLSRVEILDNRKMSKDYIFKHLFCPSSLHSEENNGQYSASANRSLSSSLPEEEGDLVTLFYNQESKEQSFITVAIAGISSYIAIDAMLDFSLIAMANFFAFTSLLSSPQAAPVPTPQLSQKKNPMEQALLHSQSFSEAEFIAAELNNSPSAPPVLQLPVTTDATSPLTRYTMNARVKMVNSKLIFLEDPSIRDSRAIVAQCAVEVHFTRETKTFVNNRVDMCESLHCSIAENELYVLRSIYSWNPIPIFERFGIEVHFRRNVVNDKPKLISVHVEVDDIDAKLSFNDLVLGIAILNRKSLVHRGNDVTMNNETTKPVTMKNAIPPNAASPYDETSILLQFGLTSLHVTLVNDFNKLPIPVLRLSAEDISFYADGLMKNMKGEGSAHMKVEYFNIPKLVWEPVLDSWKPGITVEMNNMLKQVTLQAEHTLQLTVSGSMLETLLKSYSVFFHENSTIVERSGSVSSEIVVQNVLGEGVDVILHDSISGSEVLNLRDGDTGAVSATADPMKKSWMKMFRLPNTVDVQVVSHGLENRRPILHLPFTVNKPKACMLLPASRKYQDTHHDKTQQEPGKVFILEAIEEEVYENSRYDPIAGQWRAPFLLGDPYSFTDASCLVRKDMQSLEIHSDKWEWSGDWEIDMDGIVGRDFDEEGWEYANSFSFFTMVSARRTFQPMDGVRRRRWTRTRVPKLEETGTAGVHTRNIFRSFTIFWDVQTLKDASRLVQIRSSFQIMNYLNCDIFVELQHSSWSKNHLIGPIKEGETFCVPLLQSYASQLRFKTGFDHSGWSPYFACNIHSYDFKSSKDVVCHHGAAASYFRMWTVREDKSLTVKLFPYVQIHNRLLCDVQFNCIDRSLESLEQGDIASGQNVKLLHANFKDELRLSVRFGAYNWSFPILIQKFKLTNGVIEMQKDVARNSLSDSLLPICYSSSVLDDYGIEITLFFKVAMIDRSDLQLSVRTDYGREAGSSSSSKRNDLTRSFVNDTERMLLDSVKDSQDLDPGFGVLRKQKQYQNNSSSLCSTSMKHDHSKDSRSTTPLMFSPASQRFPLIENVENLSQQNPLLVKIDVGTQVYTDSTYRWTHLPQVFRNKYSIRFANIDRIYRSSQFFSFTTTTNTIVYLLVDAKFVPKWISSTGFQPTTELAISRRIHQNRLLETNYRVFGKEFPAMEQVVLGGAWGNAEPNMYSAILVTSADWKQEEKDAIENSQHDLTISGAGPMSPRSQLANSSYAKLFQQITHHNNFDLTLAGLCWTEGCQGVTAFYSRDNYVRIRTGNEENWSDEISIDTRKNSSTKGSIEIHSERSSIIYHVSYSLQNLPGLYHRTELVTFMPRFCVLNCLEESVFIAQRGSHRHLEFRPYTPEGWHQIDDKLGFDVQFRAQSTMWSLGAVNINEIGSTVLYIPYAGTAFDALTNSTTNANSNNNGSNCRGMVLHVEVKLASHTDRCSIIVVIWQETIESQATMSVQNETDLPITIRQADLELDHDLGNKESLYELVVPPRRHLPYGLCDPEIGQNVLVTVGTSIQHASKRIATLNILKVGLRLRLPYSLVHANDINNNNTSSNSSLAIRGEVILTLTTSDVGHVLRITKAKTLASIGGINTSGSQSNITDLLNDDVLTEGTIADDTSSSATSHSLPPYADMPSLFCFKIQLSSFGMSLVLEKPHRREFLSLYLDGIQMKLQSRGTVNTLEFAVMDLQVDNYSESAIYPIILRSTKKEIHKSVLMDGEEEYYAHDPEVDGHSSLNYNQKKCNTTINEEIEKPLIQLLLVQDKNVESQQAIFQRIVLRILPLAMEVDSATLQILFLDLLDDLKILTNDQAIALSIPQKWHYEFNRALFYPAQHCIDMIDVKIVAQRPKMYIKKFTIHPMKMTISFYQTALPRRSKQETLQSALLNLLLQLTGVEKMQIRLSSFDVEDVMETYDTLLSLIVTKSGQDIRSQLASIAGSLAVLGSPIGFARKVGGGVKAFFYEPYLGVVEGSNDFLSGLKKGTTRLISGVVTGTMDSAAAMIGSASKSISYLTGDEDYVRKRAIKRQQIRQGQKGIYAGFKEGGESFVTGIASGVTGMIAKPIEEAAKSGVKGFLKGLGLGVLGMAIKPLVGLTDGITSIAYGISTEVDPNNVFVHVRPPRALEPSPLDPSNWVLVPLNLDAAFAQEFVMKRSVQHKYDDRFLTYVPLSNKDEAVILSEVYIFWRRKKNLWGRVWANISHCVPLGTGLGIMLYSGALQGKAELVVIPCGTTSVLRRLYTTVAQNVHRMGNPAKVVPAALVDWQAQSFLVPATISSSFTASVSSTTESIHHLQQLLHEQQLVQTEHYRRLLRDASLLSELDGHRFGSVNGKVLPQPHSGTTEIDVLTRTQHAIQRGSRSWKDVDDIVWSMLWEWGCIHANLASCRVAATLLINRSDAPLQVTRVHMIMGRNVTIMGSKQTGYEAESRILWPRGYVLIVLVAFPQSPLEIGHLKGTIHSAAFTLMVASTQRESSCEAKGGFTTGFLEKTVSEWWSKYVVLVS